MRFESTPTRARPLPSAFDAQRTRAPLAPPPSAVPFCTRSPCRCDDQTNRWALRAYGIDKSVDSQGASAQVHWGGFTASDGARRVISKMLTIVEADRPTAEQVLADPWFGEGAALPSGALEGAAAAIAAAYQKRLLRRSVNRIARLPRGGSSASSSVVALGEPASPVAVDPAAGKDKESEAITRLSALFVEYGSPDATGDASTGGNAGGAGLAPDAAAMYASPLMRGNSVEPYMSYPAAAYTVSHAQLLRLLPATGVDDETLAELEARNFFRLVDHNNSGSLSWKEFLALAPLLLSIPMGELPDASLYLFFRIWDRSNDGLLQKEEVREMFAALRIAPSEDDLARAFASPEDALSVTSFIEFVKRSTPQNSAGHAVRLETSRGGDPDADVDMDGGAAGGAAARQ